MYIYLQAGGEKIIFLLSLDKNGGFSISLLVHCTSSTECELLLILQYQRLSLASSKNGPSYRLTSHHGIILKAISRDPVLCKSLTMLTCLRGSIEIAIIGPAHLQVL